MSLGGEVVLSHGSSNSGGVAIHFSKCCTPVSYKVTEIAQGKLIVVQAVLEHLNVVFINVYAPTDGNERVRFLHEISAFLNTCNSDDFLFLAGDFNCTEDDSVDRNHAEPHAASKCTLKQVCRSHDLVDIRRRTHNNDRQYTWAHTRENIVSLARLDRFYVFKHHLFKITIV